MRSSPIQVQRKTWCSLGQCPKWPATHQGRSAPLTTQPTAAHRARRATAAPVLGSRRARRASLGGRSAAGGAAVGVGPRLGVGARAAVWAGAIRVGRRRRRAVAAAAAAGVAAAAGCGEERRGRVGGTRGRRSALAQVGASAARPAPRASPQTASRRAARMRGARWTGPSPLPTKRGHLNGAHPTTQFYGCNDSPAVTAVTAGVSAVTAVAGVVTAAWLGARAHCELVGGFRAWCEQSGGGAWQSHAARRDGQARQRAALPPRPLTRHSLRSRRRRCGGRSGARSAAGR